MKVKVSLKDKEASIDADVEKLVEKHMELADKNPDRKSRYQIRQEEKRKNETLKQKRPERKSRYQIRQEEKRKNAEQEHRHKIQVVGIMLGILGVMIIFSIIAGALGW